MTWAASGSWWAETTNVLGLMMPAFCAAILARVSPSTSMWSMLMEAITSTRVVVMTLVASSRPPQPTSRVTMSQCFSLK